MAQDLAAGTYRIVWDGTDDRRQAVAAGVYFYRLVAGEFAASQKLTMLDGSKNRHSTGSWSPKAVVQARFDVEVSGIGIETLRMENVQQFLIFLRFHQGGRGLHHRDQNHEGGVMKHLLVLLAVALVAVILLRLEAPAQPEELTLADVFSIRIKTLEAKMDRLVELQLDLESKPNIKDKAKYKRRLLDSFRRDISSLNMKSKRLLEGGSN